MPSPHWELSHPQQISLFLLATGSVLPGLWEWDSSGSNTLGLPLLEVRGVGMGQGNGADLSSERKKGELGTLWKNIFLVELEAAEDPIQRSTSIQRSTCFLAPPSLLVLLPPQFSSEKETLLHASHLHQSSNLRKQLLCPPPSFRVAPLVSLALSLLQAVSTPGKAVTTSTAPCWDHKWFWIQKLQNYCNPCVLDSSVESTWEIYGKGLFMLPECSGEWIKHSCAKENG